MRAVTGVERVFGEDELIVSKTDRAGRIIYANDVFARISGYSLGELYGKPHNVVRHPEMPRGVFKLLWDTLELRSEVFAYVMNLTKRGDHYWVFAHITPSFDRSGQVMGYHSNRRTPNRAALPAVIGLYGELLAEEARHGDRRVAAAASARLLEARLADRGSTYGELMFELDGLGAAA
jgi:PAS domain S-box-containing protein